VYRDLIALRKAHLRLFVDGTRRWLVTDDANALLAYERALGASSAIVAFNASDTTHEFAVPADGTYRAAYPAGGTVTATSGAFRAVLAPRAAQVWIRE